MVDLLHWSRKQTSKQELRRTHQGTGSWVYGRVASMRQEVNQAQRAFQAAQPSGRRFAPPVSQTHPLARDTVALVSDGSLTLLLGFSNLRTAVSIAEQTANNAHGLGLRKNQVSINHLFNFEHRAVSEDHNCDALAGTVLLSYSPT